MSAYFCCAFFRRATQDGTDNDGYASAIIGLDDVPWSIGSVAEPLRLCPWCGERLRSPDGKSWNVDPGACDGPYRPAPIGEEIPYTDKCDGTIHIAAHYDSTVQVIVNDWCRGTTRSFVRPGRPLWG